MSKEYRAVIGALGCVLTTIGLFGPIIHVPLVGGLSLVSGPDGKLMLILRSSRPTPGCFPSPGLWKAWIMQAKGKASQGYTQRDGRKGGSAGSRLTAVRYPSPP